MLFCGLILTARGKVRMTQQYLKMTNDEVSVKIIFEISVDLRMTYMFQQKSCLWAIRWYENANMNGLARVSAWLYVRGRNTNLLKVWAQSKSQERACFLSVQFASDGKLLFLPSILNSSLLSFIDLLKSIKVNLFNRNRSLRVLLCWAQLLSDLMRNASGLSIMNGYDQIFRGARGGGWGGVSSERCLKWFVGGHFKGIYPKTS